MDIAHDKDTPCKEVISLILGNIQLNPPEVSVSVYSVSNGAITLSRVRGNDYAYSICRS